MELILVIKKIILLYFILCLLKFSDKFDIYLFFLKS